MITLTTFLQVMKCHIFVIKSVMPFVWMPLLLTLSFYLGDRVPIQINVLADIVKYISSSVLGLKKTQAATPMLIVRRVHSVRNYSTGHMRLNASH